MPPVPQAEQQLNDAALMQLEPMEQVMNLVKLERWTKSLTSKRIVVAVLLFCVTAIIFVWLLIEQSPQTNSEQYPQETSAAVPVVPLGPVRQAGPERLQYAERLWETERQMELELAELERQAELKRLVNSGTSEAAGAAKKFNDDLHVTSLIEFLSTAPAAYNRLTELWYRKPETVVYRVDLSSPKGPSLPQALKGEPVKVELPVTPNMSVELTGSAGLDIEPKGKLKKRVSDAAPTSWEWKVTPIGTGEQFLTLKTYVHISEKKDSEPHTVKSYEDVIKVNVQLWDRLSMVVSTVQPVWAFAGIVVAALAGAYGWFRRKGWRANKKPFSEIQGIRRSNKKS